jgi:peptidoglycan/xylan/chitin deacetylase (PgdA/CDA1 family)
MRAILTYHSVDASGSPISVSPSAFSRHAAWLASGRVQVTTIPELLAMPDDRDAVALTFDDGFENFETVAAPLLLRHRLPATVFIVSGYVGGANTWTHHQPTPMPRLRLMDWRAVRRVAAAGFAVGAHTETHADLAALPADAAHAEITRSIAAIEAVVDRPTLFAYPYGRVSGAAVSILAATCDAACTTEFRCLGQGEAAPLLPRIDMYYFQRPDSLDAWGTPRFSWYLRARATARRVRARFARTA